MKTFLISMLLVVNIALADQITFTWSPGANQLTNSAFTLWQGSVTTLNYSKRYFCYTTNFTLDSAALDPGINHFCVTQISTNSLGQVMDSVFSGELQIVSQPAVAVTMPLMCSTNLGMSWSLAASNIFIFPTAAQQKFFMAGQLKIARTNIVTFPSPP